MVTLLQMHEVFKVQGDEEWSAALLDVKPQVILHDRLMTDAALGTAPIKTEHSYCSSPAASPPNSSLDMEGTLQTVCLSFTAPLARSDLVILIHWAVVRFVDCLAKIRNPSES